MTTHTKLSGEIAKLKVRNTKVPSFVFISAMLELASVWLLERRLYTFTFSVVFKTRLKYSEIHLV